MKTGACLNELCERGGIHKVVAACGVFDGIHRGHRRILAALLEEARQHHAVPTVLTFDPHPRAVLQPELAPRFLTVKEQKLRLLGEAGVEAVVFLPFSRPMAALAPAAFVRRYLSADNLKVHGVCVGANWRFGVRAQGDAHLLQRLGRSLGFSVTTVPELNLYGIPVSSTRIRDAIVNGRLGFAARLLGRPYSVYGRVCRGTGVGSSQIGCPTANLVDQQVLLPPCGVYAARAFLDHCSSQLYAGIAYVGTAPTRQDLPATREPHPILEFHFFDFSGDLYGRTMEVEFGPFLRPDCRFESLTALRRQIRDDIARARQLTVTDSLSRGSGAARDP